MSNLMAQSLAHAQAQSTVIDWGLKPCPRSSLGCDDVSGSTWEGLHAPGATHVAAADIGTVKQPIYATTCHNLAYFSITPAQMQQMLAY